MYAIKLRQETSFLTEDRDIVVRCEELWLKQRNTFTLDKNKRLLMDIQTAESELARLTSAKVLETDFSARKNVYTLVKTKGGDKCKKKRLKR